MTGLATTVHLEQLQDGLHGAHGHTQQGQRVGHQLEPMTPLVILENSRYISCSHYARQCHTLSSCRADCMARVDTPSRDRG